MNVPGSIKLRLMESLGYIPRPFGCGSKPMVPFSGRCSTHFSLFSGDWDVHWGYGLLTHAHLVHWGLASIWSLRGRLSSPCDAYGCFWPGSQVLFRESGEVAVPTLLFFKLKEYLHKVSYYALLEKHNLQQVSGIFQLLPNTYDNYLFGLAKIRPKKEGLCYLDLFFPMEIY